MKVVAQPIWLNDLSQRVKNSLSNINRRVVDGMDKILISPNMERISDEDIRRKARSLLESHNITPELEEIEHANAVKLGPRSQSLPWVDRKASLLAYFRERPGGKDVVPSLRLEEQERGGEIPPSGGTHSPSLRPVRTSVAIRNLVPSSNSGLPYLVRNRAVRMAHAEESFNKGGLGRYPCVLFTRTGEDRKTRNIWGYPFDCKLKEQTFLIPFIQREKEWPHRAALKGPDFVDTKISELLFSKSEDESIVCVDFEAFDASVSQQLISSAFSTIKANFQKGYHDDIEEIQNIFGTIPIHTPDGDFEGAHGVPSGSGFTNTIDSEAQRQAAGFDWHAPCQIQGDDGVYRLKSDSVDRFLEGFQRMGLKVNRDKTRVFSDRQAVYLQRYYHPSYTSTGGQVGGVYPISRALARIKYLESFTDFEKQGIEGKDFFALRTIMILENCKHHPAFQGLVRYVQSVDKYGLSYSDKGLKAFSRLYQSKARAGQWISQEESRVSGLASFATVQVLSEV